MSKTAVWRQTSPTIYRIKNVKTGLYHCGGHSASSGFYTSVKAVKGLFTMQGFDPENYVIEEYTLTLNKTCSLKEL